jgi:hypothetical protein
MQVHGAAVAYLAGACAATSAWSIAVNWGSNLSMFWGTLWLCELCISWRPLRVKTDEQCTAVVRSVGLGFVFILHVHGGIHAGP